MSQFVDFVFEWMPAFPRAVLMLMTIVDMIVDNTTSASNDKQLTLIVRSFSCVFYKFWEGSYAQNMTAEKMREVELFLAAYNQTTEYLMDLQSSGFRRAVVLSTLPEIISSLARSWLHVPNRMHCASLHNSLFVAIQKTASINLSLDPERFGAMVAAEKAAAKDVWMVLSGESDDSLLLKYTEEVTKGELVTMSCFVEDSLLLKYSFGMFTRVRDG